MTTVAEELAGWGTGLQDAAVPHEVRAAAVRHLVDGVGTALAARRLDAVDHGIALAVGLGGPPESSVLGTTERLSAPVAAFATGVLVHGLDFDDTHAGGLIHPTAVVLPAAFAVGQQVGATGTEVLTACVVGYETACRIAAASPYGFHARGLHATQVAGVFSAAAVTAKLLRLDAPTTAAALGIAGSSAGGLLEFLSTGDATKQLHPGSASMSGVIAARLAALGASGPTTVLEGPRGVYAALSAREARPEQVTDRLGSTWETTRITIKPYPSCQLMHAALDAGASVVAAAGRLAEADVAHITVEVHPDSAAVVCEPAEAKARPRNAYDARFSLPWSLAALLTDGVLTLDTYADVSLARPDVAALAETIRTVTVPGPKVAADAAARVTVRLTDGRVLTGRVGRSHGGPDTPLPQAALHAKFLGNTGGGGTAEELLDRLLHLDDEADLTRIAELAARVDKD
ncbi:MmgE/PrpD family protein [Yinghuangia seranimata]|uniref:MmgE/PrpD family protein n=1 Tax=Yinghuangia seranimata TaxID=408067 RepID=UPI00248CDCD4|nr:MmgE/PrpD family protein [Yinghuangia seranimata]MDI2132452.1 MmgE/PrpD family protein [Yinghuangia seranimata]